MDKVIMSNVTQAVVPIEMGNTILATWNNYGTFAEEGQ